MLGFLPQTGGVAVGNVHPGNQQAAVRIVHPGNQQAAAHSGDWFPDLSAGGNELLQSGRNVFSVPIYDGPGLPALAAIGIETQLRFDRTWLSAWDGGIWLGIAESASLQCQDQAPFICILHGARTQTGYSTGFSPDVRC